MRFRNAWAPCALIMLALSVAPAAAQGKGQAKGHGKQSAKAHKAPKVKHDKHATKVGNGPNIRFHGMDRNNDGVVSRAEWRGNDRSFSNAD